MKTLLKLDWNVLKMYIQNNLIIANKHPEYDLWILNYSPKVQAKKLWDDYTISCRGLIIDSDGNILARPFKKFKNYEEHDPSEIDMTKKFEIFEKVDGSLIILFYYELRMEWIFASRGSFISEQCLEAKKMFNMNILKHLDTKNTYLFEIIYPENRIVVNYGDKRDLILLGIIETSTGKEIEYNTMKNEYSNYFTIVNKLEIANINNFIELKKLEESNKEGFVVRFSDGFRVKVKFSEYVRLHGILTNVSNVVVWEHLMNGYDFDSIYNNIPDKFYNWLQKTIAELQNNYYEIERESLKEFIRIYYINELIERKEFAYEAVKSKYRSILFKLYDKKQYDDIIWVMIKPKYSKPFKNDDN